MGRGRSPRGLEKTAWRGLACVVGCSSGDAPDTPRAAPGGGVVALVRGVSGG